MRDIRITLGKREEKLLEKKNKPYSIIFIGAFNIILFITMLVYISVYAYTHKVEMIDNSYNAHQALLKKQNTRGTIYSSDCKELAVTLTDENGDEKRDYPFGKVFAHAVGFASNGRSGLEDLANYYLINSDISLSQKAKAYDNGEKYPGNNVYSSLDTNLQQTSYDALSAHKGAVIVTEVKTGRILAMVSKPDFDPNSIERDWDELTKDDGNTELLNRVSQGLYPPGSTFKIITALEYYRENHEAYKDFSFTCTGSFSNGSDTINCYHGENHGKLDFTKAFAKSCNSAFANISLTLDKSSFNNTLKDLMFGDVIPWDMSASVSNANCDENTSSGDMMQLAIGQGTDTISPLHLNMITMAIANDGMLVKPRLIDSVVSAEGKVIKKYDTENYKRLLSVDEADFLQQLMEEVVNTGTATKLKGLTYSAAGKTGSAEFMTSSSDSHAWFTGFAPCENPQIAVTIIVENAGSGGEFAVPIAKRVFDTYFGVD